MIFFLSFENDLRVAIWFCHTKEIYFGFLSQTEIMLSRSKLIQDSQVQDWLLDMTNSTRYQTWNLFFLASNNCNIRVQK